MILGLISTSLSFLLSFFPFDRKDSDNFSLILFISRDRLLETLAHKLLGRCFRFLPDILVEGIITFPPPHAGNPTLSRSIFQQVT
jgi:hypothetical protein